MLHLQSMQDQCLEPFQERSVKCCDIAGGGCFTTCERLSFDEAFLYCGRIGKRLCTQEELGDGRCCSKSCNRGAEFTWTSTPCSKDSPYTPPFVVEGQGTGIGVSKQCSSAHFDALCANSVAVFVVCSFLLSPGCGRLVPLRTHGGRFQGQLCGFCGAQRLP